MRKFAIGFSAAFSGVMLITAIRTPSNHAASIFGGIFSFFLILAIILAVRD